MTPTLNDYSLVRSKTDKKQQDHGFPDLASAFYFVVIDLILGLQDDEIQDSITDSNFLRVSHQQSGHDRGVDALYIDEASTPPVIHIFNFKYAESFNKAKNNNFPSGDIDKILGFINALNQQEASLLQEINPVLASKVQDIWRIFESQNPKFFFHFFSNYYQGFEKAEKERLERSIGRNIGVQSHLMGDSIEYIYSENKQIVSGKIKGIDKVKVSIKGTLKNLMETSVLLS